MKNSYLKQTFIALFCATALGVSAAPREGIPAVRVEKSTSINRSEGKSYVGNVTPSKTVDIVARVSGTLWKAAFKEGSFVKKGDLLFHIEDTIYKENVNAARAAVAQIKAQLEYALSEKNRYVQLYADKATAKTNLESAIRTYELNKAQLAEAQAKLALAENDLSYTRIYSPLNGQIGSNYFSEGNYITPAKGSMATIGTYAPCKVRFAMSERDFFKFRQNHSLNTSGIQIRRADGELYKGSVKIDFFDNKIDPKTGTMTIELELSNKDMFLIPGGYVTVKAAEVFKAPLPSVSASALLSDGKNSFVYVVRPDNSVEQRYVTPGPLVETRQTILKGLKNGETVVISGMNKIRKGVTVKPVFGNK